MIELYRSFYGLLDCKHQWCYVVYDYNEEQYLIKEISVWKGHDALYTVYKNKVSDITDFDSIVAAL